MDRFVEHLRDALDPAYELGAELPGAGMSRVFAATERALGRTVVVKVLPPELAAGVNRERFRREIQLAAQLQHPHIVPLLSAGEHGEVLYYTMPFIEGESLRARLERAGRLPVRDVLRVLHDVVDALAYAHARGVIHRDIKPANILTHGQHALVTDFGVAKAISAALPAAGVTTSGMAIGTPAYMAPEQLAADPAADHRVDLYAVGLLAYELLSGESPFVGPSPAATMAAQLTRDPPALHSVRPDVPPALGVLVARCLAKDPEGRPDSAGALLAELDGMPGAASGSAPLSAPAPRPPARPPARRWAAAAAGLAVLGVAGAVALAGRDPSPAKVTVEPAPAPAETTAHGARSTPPAALTRDDSLAIVRAFGRQLSGSRPAAAAPRDSFAALEGRALEQASRAQRMVDSLVRTSLQEWSTLRAPAAVPGVQEVPAAGGVPRASERTRVVVTEPDDLARHPGLSSLGRALARELRTLLRQRAEFRVVTSDSVRDVQGRTRDVGELAALLDADVVASVGLVPLPGDSVILLVRMRDLGAAPQFAYRVAGGTPVAVAGAAERLAPTLRQAAEEIAGMRRAPRRPPAPPRAPAAPGR
jgi:serine/threonine-protein kinase